MTTLAFIGLSRNTAIVIAVTTVVTALVVCAIWLVWARSHPDVTTSTDRRRTLTPTFLLLIISVLMNGVGMLGVSAVTTDTNHVVSDTRSLLKIVQDQTSPEARRKQNALLDGVLVKVDCNAASRLQRGFDALAEQGLIQPVDVTLGCGHVQSPTTTAP